VFDFLEGAFFTEFGLMSHTMDAARPTALTGDGVRAPLEDPGPLPEASTQAQTSLHKYKTDAYEKQQKALKAAKATIIAPAGTKVVIFARHHNNGHRGHHMESTVSMWAQHSSIIVAVVCYTDWSFGKQPNKA
jgi:hypothetical protein